MIDRRSQVICFGFLLSDMLFTSLSWFAAYHVRFESVFANFLENCQYALTSLGIYYLGVESRIFGGSLETIPFYLCWRQLPIVLVLALVAYRMAGQYDIGRLRRFREETVAVLRGTALLSLFVMSTLFFLHDPYESRVTMILFWSLSVVSVVVARRIGWGFVRTLRSRGYNQTYSLIVGTGRGARRLAGTLDRLHWLGIKNIGFIEEKTSPLSGDLDVLGGFADLPALVQKYGITHIFISLPFNRFNDVRRVYGVLSQVMVEIRLVPELPALAGLTLTTANLDGLPVIGLRESPHFGLNIFIKRGMDIVLSLIGLILLSPLLTLIAVLVKLSSPGPVLFKQERCGLNGENFEMLKFRSMRVDAEKDTGAVWAKKDDNRRTWLGTFLRQSSLDELPQLWNVLMGHMSLVGPRPERPEFIKQFRKTIPNYMARHSVKAGLTGSAQVHGWRGNTSLRKRVEYDLYYITHWTPWLDIRILWLTLFRGLVNKNAY